MDPPEPAMMNRACWGVETVERRRGAVGSGVPARRGGERRRGAVGSGDGGVWRDSMGSGV
jgi:hypothetical protein